MFSFVNPLVLTDSYKVTHWKQYPKNTQTVYSYFESRGGEFDELVFFGLQYLLTLIQGTFVTEADIDEAKALCEHHFGTTTVFNELGWHYILSKHKGKLPLRIKAVPEGTVISPHNVLMTIENTDPNCFWLTNWIETLLVQLWYPITVATNSREIKKIIKDYLVATGGSVDKLPFCLHDFGFRGSTSIESSQIGGAAHLVNFMGTDTMSALSMIKRIYMNPCAGFSVPASEHSTITSWGKPNEVEAFRNMLDQYPTGIVACVSDSFDIFKACEDLWGTQLKEKIENRKGTLVVRPDSGDPVEVVNKVLEILASKFGYSVTSTGHMLLPPYIRVIQGDGVNRNSIKAILESISKNGWCTENIAFGSGGALLQKFDRDTCKFAFKCSAIQIDNQWQDVYKDPITQKDKKSKAGRLVLIKEDDGSFTTEKESPENFRKDHLKTVFLNGDIKEYQSFQSIRKLADV